MALHRSGSYLSFPVFHCSVFFLRHVLSPSVLHYHLLFFSSPTFLSILTTFLSNIFSLLPRTVSLPYHFLLYFSRLLCQTFSYYMILAKFKYLATSYQTSPPSCQHRR
ncbi:hypothetical protein BDV40DRAFT_162651 [Aspergillus tamarii]|uniref:Uncharacterized protein n=1 Tax=Aspergillus tamarii TaxID=41984 RepID=A0A5N6UUG4_ASPTM|nr:hypothetical protein BDV40DRAFT_162651 [Aspergillus tamarii]